MHVRISHISRSHDRFSSSYNIFPFLLIFSETVIGTFIKFDVCFGKERNGATLIRIGHKYGMFLVRDMSLKLKSATTLLDPHCAFTSSLELVKNLKENIYIIQICTMMKSWATERFKVLIF